MERRSMIPSEHWRLAAFVRSLYELPREIAGKALPLPGRVPKLHLICRMDFAHPQDFSPHFPS
jgi:hypothetical protein